MRLWLAVLAPFALWLGAGFIEPALTQTGNQELKQLNPSATHADRNWRAFWKHHLGDWRGSWTRYAPSGKVKEIFASSRLFRADPAKSEIVQVNRYRYADGRLIEKTWAFNIKDHSHADGFAHPASDAMRGLALDNGSAAWLIPTLKPNQFAPFELFLKLGDIRHSVGVLYGKSGELLRTASIREQRGNQSNFNWTESVAQVKPWNPVGRWEGEKRQIQADLSRIPVQRTDWQWINNNQTNHFLPDRIILRCPERITPGQAFSIRVIWLVDDGELQTITAHYNSEFQLMAVTHQALTPES